MGGSMTTLQGLRIGAGGGVVYARSWTGRSGRGGRQPLVAALVISMLVAALGVGTTPTYSGSPVSVIVRAVSGGAHQVEELVTEMGGSIELRLPIIDGFSASLPADALPILERSTAVLSLSPNTPLAPQDGTYDPAGDINSMVSTTRYSGASRWWDAGYTGAGVDVAVIDTGVSPVQGLSAPGKLIYGPDLSIESQAPNLTNLDSYGHGTFMAGLIAGRDTDMVAPYSSAPASQYRGMAPDARIVSVKVGSADGGTDVSQVIAAISWVVQHAHDPGINIRVLNLSYGTNSTQAYTLDPLAFAAEVAWKHGIVVVASGGNSGFQKSASAPALSNPAIDPFLIAVGASNPNGTSWPWDDVVPDFSPRPISWGTRGVDLVSPGFRMQGLRVPNSFIDVNHPSAVMGDRYFRGSGTSEAAAITSGAAALIIQKHPLATPDQVKKLLTNSAQWISAGPLAVGSGELDLRSAFNTSLPNWTQTWTPSTGLGSLELARGTDHLTQDGVVLSGEQDIMGSPFDAATMAGLQTQGASWSGGDWNGKSWSGASWSGASWSGASWSGASWSGKSWSSCEFAGASWSGVSWSGASWSGASWSGASWSGASWSGQAWAGANWN
jgi:serine protease AprX